MAAVIRALIKGYGMVFGEYSDPRTKDFFLAGSPIPIFALLYVYHSFVYKWGPELMKNRKPFNIDRLIQVYNVLQVIACSWLAINMYLYTYGPYGGYSWKCQPVGTSHSEPAVRLAQLCWYYYMIKIIDLLDTVFFVMRKKYSQVTFLHVVHHMGMIIVGWVATKYLPGGHGLFVGTINNFVHAFMYAYYFLSNYDIKYKQNLWWKKYITQLQMFQFLCIIIHLGHVLLQSSCDYPKWPITLFLPGNVAIFYMFWKFYEQAYLNPKINNNEVKTS